MNEKTLREAIIQDTQSNWFVEAGAGAGKTWIIVERIINQLKSGDFLPENIVVITFTRKAAGELSERIVKRLQEIIGNDDESALTEKEIQHLSFALENIEQMNISTIHSFCYKLLMARSFDAKIPLDVALLEEEADLERKRQFFDEWYRQIGYENYRKLKALYDAPKKILFNVFCQISNLPKDTKVLYDASILKEDFNEESEAKIVLKDYFDLLLAKINLISGRNYTDLKEALDEPFIKKSCRDNILSLPEKGAYAVLKTLHAKDLKKRYFKKKAKVLEEDDALLFNEEVYSAMDEQVSQINERKMAYTHALFVSMALKAREYFRQHKDSSILTNDDLLQKARDLVCENEKARKVFQEQYHCIYVDEFQDTDHVQAEMILNLCGEKDADGSYALRPGNLFVVGDPKQSIYGFRGAELDVYYRVKEIFEDQKIDNGKIATLHWNFRSNPVLIEEWINPNFEKRFNGLFEDPNMASPNQNALIDDIDLIEGVYCTQHVVMPGHEEADILKKEDALACCRLIKNLVYGKKKIRDKDAEKGMRPILFSDFLVLSRNKMDTKFYLQTFQDEQIPFDVSGKIDLSMKRMFNRYIRLYKGLVTPLDPLARAGAEEVLTGQGYRDAREKWHELGEKCRKLDGIALAEALLHHPELYCDRDEVIEKSIFLSSQAELIQMVESVCAGTINDGAYLADALEGYIQKTLEQQLKLSEKSNAVRIMNLHKAKGLEGNIVIIAMRNEKTTFKGSTYQESVGEINHYYPALKLSQYQSILGYPANSDVWERAKKQSDEENMRLEYVAATRAKEALFFMDALNTDCTFLKDFDFENCRPIEPLLEDKFEAPGDFEVCDYVVKDYRAQIDESQKQPTMITISPSLFEGTAVLYDAKDVEDRPKGNIFGNMVHRTFELLISQIIAGGNINCEVPVNRAIMENWEDSLFEEEGDKAQYFEYLLKYANDFVHDERLCTAIQKADEVYTELPFGFTVTVGEDETGLIQNIGPILEEKGIHLEDGQKLLVHGFSDLVLVNEKDGEKQVRIIDYKSDMMNGMSREIFESQLKARYSGQMCLYRAAMSYLLDVPMAHITTEIKDLYGEMTMIL